MPSNKLRITASALALVGALTVGTLAATPASAATARNGVCESGEICFYWGSDLTGSVSDHSATDLANYGSTQPGCYEFKGSGVGQGQCIKNNVYSVWNRSGKNVRVHFNSYYGGDHQTVEAGNWENLASWLSGDNASHNVAPY